ncbi:MAG: transporter [Verrucomicrobia bacterium]|nr:transporter [Verrucomicrobiota bacterium]
MKLANLGKQISAAGLSLLATVGVARAAEPAADKSRCHLFNLTPRELMRELSTDRPDKTESPFTVDAGHFQIEMDLVHYSYDKHNPARDGTIVRTWSIAPMNLKVGLLNNVDLQLVLQPHGYGHTSDPAAGVSKQRGFGDMVARLKWNLWGNDGGDTAFALMPYLKLPTNQDQLGNRSVEGGLIAPLAVELPAGWGLGLMTQLDIVRDGGTSGYHPEFVNSITFSHDIAGKLGGYVEFFSSVSTERGSAWIGTLDVGLTYGLTENIQLDAGVNFGLTRAADDVNPFVGITFRF